MDDASRQKAYYKRMISHGFKRVSFFLEENILNDVKAILKGRKLTDWFSEAVKEKLDKEK